MANTPVQFKAPTGLTLTLKLYPYGSDTIANGAGDAAAEKTNNKGTYEAIVAEAITGWHDASIVDGSGNVSAAYSVYLEDDTEIKRCHDAADRIWPVEDGAVPPAAAGASGGLIRHTTDLTIASGKAAATVATGDGVDAATLLGLYRPFTGTIISGVAAEIFETSLTGLQAGVLEGQTIVFAAGSGIAGQRATIIAYDSGTGAVTVPPGELAGQPNISDPFIIIQSQRDIGTVTQPVSVTVAGYDTGQAPLRPTVAGRTLDVSATGEANANVISWAGEDVDVDLGNNPRIGTVLGNVDGSVGTIGATGLTAIAAAVWDRLTSALVTVGSVGAYLLANLTGGGASSLASGTVASTTGSTTTLDTGATATADLYKHSLLVLLTGTGAGQERLILGYTAARVAAHTAWTTVPNAATTYEIRAAGVADLIKVLQARRN